MGGDPELGRGLEVAEEAALGGVEDEAVDRTTVAEGLDGLEEARVGEARDEVEGVGVGEGVHVDGGAQAAEIVAYERGVIEVDGDDVFFGSAARHFFCLKKMHYI